VPELQSNPKTANTIQQTLMTSLLFEGFWDRWIAHGIERPAAAMFRGELKSLGHWTRLLAERSKEYETSADSFLTQGTPKDAERLYRTAGLHYNLIQWIFPETCSDKREWYNKCKEQFKLADAITKDRIEEAVVRVNGKQCYGRIRIPEDPKGCVIIINPIDSSKEELFTYEMDFAAKGFVTVSFDGPGQGESYVLNGHKATLSGWDLFVRHVIDFTAERFPFLSIHLFGTSSGASWAIHGSRHPKVNKVVAVSPACGSDVKMPEYFTQRMSYILDDNTETILPDLTHLQTDKRILLFHGNQDVMVKDEDMYRLYKNLPFGKRLVEYESEGHCCNFKLNELRQDAIRWYLEATDDI
jgi:hypothetical protein